MRAISLLHDESRAAGEEPAGGEAVARDFVWLLLHALRKLPPSKARVVYRGMVASVGAKGGELQWSAFSSTATKLDAGGLARCPTSPGGNEL